MYKKQILFILSGLALPWIILIVSNIIIDPFGLLSTPIFKITNQLNERYVKIEYLKKHHNEYNSYIFGSSRIGTTDPDLIAHYINGTKFYNMTVSGGNPYDFRLFLKYFISKKYDVKYLYLQLDIYELLFTHGQSGYLSGMHPEVLGNNIGNYIMKYLINYDFSALKVKLNDNFNIIENKPYNIKKGNWYRPDREARINQNPEQYIKSEGTFLGYDTNKVQINDAYKANLAALKEIVQICANNEIKLIVFVTPHNYNLMRKIQMEDYLNFLFDIAQITPYYNFCYPNFVTENNFYYYEWSHYRPIVAELIAKKIFTNDQSIIFGAYIDSHNIQEYLDLIKSKRWK